MRTPRLVAGLTAVFLAAWAAAHAPALGGAWWFFDDYSVADVLSRGNVAHHLGQGRPGQLVWMLTFFLDRPPGGAAANVALRFLQGLLHAATGALVAALWYRQTRRRGTLLAGLPFVLWPYAGETVLWRAAGEYPMAALLAACGAWIIRGRARPGWPADAAAAGLVAAAMLTHQLAACVGLAAWAVAVALTSMGSGPLPGRALRREALALAAGYAAGGLAGYALAWLTASHDMERLVPATDPGAKLSFLTQANRTFFLEAAFYPPWLALAQLGLVAAGVLALLGSSREPWPARRRGLALIGLASLLVTPYAAHLAVADDQVSWRVFYGAPLVFGAAWTLADAAPSSPRVLRVAAGLLYAAVLAAWLPLAWASARVYPALFEADRALLRRIEARAREERLPTVVVDTQTLPSTMNPHGLDVRWGGPKPSAFLAEWAAPPFIERFSSLECSKDRGLQEACIAFCAPRAAARPGDFTVHRLEAGPALCVCPP